MIFCFALKNPPLNWYIVLKTKFSHKAVVLLVYNTARLRKTQIAGPTPRISDSVALR
jgi:hypothetical protein